MTFGPGARLGPYEVTALLGEGGMGKVWRAHHTALRRDDALKVLPDAFASDPERLARFRREAQVLASLNHPNIAHVYGLEQWEGVPALVMELVEGETLADRIARGPIPVSDALPIARQIAEALEAAHEQGIIHRDLKPANIKLRPDGTVKVLDFGLAKLADAPARGVGDANVTASPTITSPALTTGVGVLLGTAAYMSPEQARGKVVDKRSDVWAFGCVLYEMLTGKAPFDGADVAVVLASVIKDEPDWTALPSEVPQPISTVLRRCLEKDRKGRVAEMATVSFVLREAAHLSDRIPDRIDAVTTAQRPAPMRSFWRRAMPAAAGLLVGAAIAGSGAWVLTRPAPPAVVRTTIATLPATELAVQGADRDVAITPDGTRIVYRGNNQLLVRHVGQLTPAVLDGLGVGLDAPRGVFVSPDGQWVGFFSGTLLQKVAITGGPAVTITRVEGGAARGATWGEDGTIIFSTNGFTTGLLRVSEAGGEPTVLTKPNRERGEFDHVWPERLPGGNAVLYTIVPVSGSLEDAQIAVLDLQSGVSKTLVRGGNHAHYVPTGHLVYGVAGTLRAVTFDLNRVEVTGTAVPLLDGIGTTAAGALDADIAANGSMVYIEGAIGTSQATLVSVDREGRATQLPGIPSDAYRDVRVSPDGTRLVLATQEDIWTYDLSRATLTRLTNDPSADTRPLWTPDGRRIVFTSVRSGYPELFWRQADGTGIDERLLTRGADLIDLQGNAWSADGKQLLVTEVIRGRAVTNQCSIAQTSVEHPGETKVLVTNGACNGIPALSPDGRWMAYISNVSGRTEVYVEKYPELGDRQQISASGGNVPIWSRDGRELFFRSIDDQQVLAAPVRTGATLTVGRPQVLFEMSMLPRGAGMRPYDVGTDGRFFIFRIGNEGGSTRAAPPTIVLSQNWFEELKRLVPTN